MEGIRLVIFDVGGVFRDSSEAINEGFRRGFSSRGLAYPFTAQDVWHLRGIGKYNESISAVEALVALAKKGQPLGPLLRRPDAEQVLDRLVEDTLTPPDRETARAIRGEYRAYFNSPEARGRITVFPYAKDAVASLKRKGYTLALFTNTSVVTVKRDLEQVGPGHFSLIVSEEDVQHKKPSGEGIVKILRSLHIPPEKAVYVGDSMVDIQAARDAGVGSVAVLSGMGLRIHLEKERPDYLFKNILEMSEKLPLIS